LLPYQITKFSANPLPNVLHTKNEFGDSKDKNYQDELSFLSMRDIFMFVELSTIHFL
jgi:hypothetical protein